MGKQGVPQRGGTPHRSLGGKILGGQAAGQTNKGQRQQHTAPHQDIAQVAGGNAGIDDVRHDQRDQKIKTGFQHFEQRSQHAFPPVATQVAQ